MGVTCPWAITEAAFSTEAVRIRLKIKAIESRAGKSILLFFIATPPSFTLPLLMHGLDNNIMLRERKQAVAAFSTDYMGFTWSGFQNSVAS
jgi:hypothetical protein